jgi:hypothetical protein
VVTEIKSLPKKIKREVGLLISRLWKTHWSIDSTIIFQNLVWRDQLGPVCSIIFDAQKMNLRGPSHVSFLPPHTLISVTVIIYWFSYTYFIKFPSHFFKKF